METITVQAIHDERDEHAQFSGSDMHALFDTILADPSPAGRVRVALADIRRVAETQHEWRFGGNPTAAARAILAALA